MTLQDKRNAPLVVKIGGSLAGSALLAHWLDALQRSPRPLTIVPGGGPFADAVRAAQRTMKFSDAAAHDMALLAMEQYAYALADQCKRLTLCETPLEAAKALARGAIALWRPFRMLRSAPDIDASWDITSDSLAAWYAAQSGARTLLLIKSVDAVLGGDLVASGVVDPRFHKSAQGLTVFIAGPKALATAAEVFASGAEPGARIDFLPRQQKVAS